MVPELFQPEARGAPDRPGGATHEGPGRQVPRKRPRPRTRVQGADTEGLKGWRRLWQPGLGASGRDRTSTKGKGNLAKEAEAASGWSARHRNRFPPNSVCAKVLRQEGTKPVGGEELGSTRLCEQVG